MHHRWITVGLPVAAVAIVVAACGADTTTSEGASSTSSQTVAGTTSGAVTSASSERTGAASTTQEPSDTSSNSTSTTATSGASDTTSPDTDTATTPPSLPPGHGVGASAFAGTWQRHESKLTLESDPQEIGTILIGASATDGEEWSLTWEPAGSGIVMTLGSRISESGAGLGGTLTAGQTITAELSTDSAGTTILRTDGVGDAGTLSWCKSGAGSPECGA